MGVLVRAEAVCQVSGFTALVDEDVPWQRVVLSAWGASNSGPQGAILG